MLSAGADGVVTLWRVGRTALGTRETAVLGAAFQPGGNLLGLAASKGSVQLWDYTTGGEVRELTGHTGDVEDLVFSADGSRLVTVGTDGLVILWDPETGEQLKKLERAGTDVSNVAFSPDGKTIAVAGHSHPADKADHDEVLLLDSRDLSIVARHPTRQEPRNPQLNPVDGNYATGISFSPDGRVLAVALTAGKIGLWNLVDPGAAWTILPGHDQAAVDVTFSADGATLASGGQDRLVRLWRVKDGRQIGEFGHDSAVRSVAFSPDGATLVTASQDSVVRLWDVRAGAPVARLDRHDDEVNDVTFDGSGAVVASASADGTAQLWHLDTEAAVRELCGALDRFTMVDEWRSLGSDRGDPPTCPS
jgi:WD40 repeat protein